MEHPLTESVWRRGWNDTKSVWTSWPCFVSYVAVGAVIGGFLEWYWGLLVVLFGLFCVWAGVTARAPCKQRDEARALLQRKRTPVPLPNRRELVGALLEVKGAALEYIDRKQSDIDALEHGAHTVNIDAIEYYGKIQQNYVNAVANLEKERLVAGKAFENPILNFTAFVNYQVIIADVAEAKENRKEGAELEEALDKALGAVISQIDEINQPNSDVEDSQT